MGLSVKSCVAHILSTSSHLTGVHPVSMQCGSASHVQLDRMHRQESCKFFTVTELFLGNVCRFGLQLALSSAVSSQL